MDPNVTMNNALVLPFYSNKYKYIDVENCLKYTRKSQAQYKFYITKCLHTGQNTQIRLNILPNVDNPA